MTAALIVGGLAAFLALWWLIQAVAHDHIEGCPDVPGSTWTPDNEKHAAMTVENADAQYRRTETAARP